ncbi:DUF916 domain-containing protein [Lacticaseibacillus porcinae]|uniref:DUF916 domain-containing protein n=1 Tax=Lacticaseibacillus porcinae TaxID=1123687 RepID=UPI000F7A1634|nr:DUF916 domain-containing protein [Lacticaseibacillus porcinae]
MFKRLFLLAAVIAGVAGGGHVVHADSVTFQVSPEFPSNQINKKLNYYNLLVAPGATQKISFLIINSDSGSHKYHVSVNRAGTSSDGDTSYNLHGVKPTQSLKVNIESLFPKPRNYTVDPHSTRRIKLTLKAPSEAWAGVLSGGIRVQQVDSNANANTNVGVTAQPAYTYGIQLQATPTIPNYTPALQFNGPKVSTNTSGSTVAALLENPNPVLQSNLFVSAKVLRKGKTVLSQDMAGIKLSPNAQMAYPLTPTPKALKAGTYQLVVDAHNGDQKWHFEDKFTIVQPVMKTKANTTTDKAVMHHFPAWLVVILIIIAFALGWLIWYLRRKQPKA